MRDPQLFERADNHGNAKIDPVLTANLNNLIGPNLMPVEDQIAVQRDMWRALGYEMPEATEGQLAAMDWQQDGAWESPKKVFIFPFAESYAESHARLLDLTGRARMITPSGGELSTLVTPTHMREAGGWKKEVSHVDHGPHQGAEALYKTRAGLVGRSDFLTIMGQEGKVLVGKDDSTWMYTMMDLSPNTDGAEAGTKVADLHEEVDHALVPEALVAMHLAHRLAGAEGQPLTADVANEVFVLGSRNDAQDRLITTVGLGSDTKRITLSYDYSEISSPHGGFGIRAGGGSTASLEQVA